MIQIRCCTLVGCTVAAMLFIVARPALAGTPVIDPRFQGEVGAENGIFEIHVQPNGKILLAASFQSFDEVHPTNLARLNPNGKADRSFQSDFAVHVPDYSFPAIYTITSQTDRRILIGGRFGIYRLKRTGRFDDSFSSETSAVNAIALQPDGRILIAGEGWEWYRRQQPLMRLNEDGSYDITFYCRMDSWREAFCVLLRPDGKILVGGTFHDVDEVGQPKLALVNTDGSLDTSFRPEVGPTSGPYVAPYDIKLQPDGKILIAGNFYLVGREYRGNIGRLNPDGSLDTSFNPFPGTSNGFDGAVNSIALQDDGRIIVAGAFTSYNGIPRNYLARLNPDGSLDESFNAGPGPSGPLSKVWLLRKNRLLIAGAFDSFDGILQGNISRLLLVDPEEDRRKPLRLDEK